MVAESTPTRFTLDPARADEFIDDLSAVENSLHDVAFKWKTTTGALSLFLASPEGRAIVAAAEIATAVHIRLQAQAMLVDVAQSMVYIVREYSREERRIPFNNDLRSIKLVELRRANARRAGHLLFRLAHYTPAPIRSYTVRPQHPDAVPHTSTPATAIDSDTNTNIETDINANINADTTACHDHPPFVAGDRAPASAPAAQLPQVDELPPIDQMHPTADAATTEDQDSAAAEPALPSLASLRVLATTTRCACGTGSTPCGSCRASSTPSATPRFASGP